MAREGLELGRVPIPTRVHTEHCGTLYIYVLTLWFYVFKPYIDSDKRDGAKVEMYSIKDGIFEDSRDDC